MRGFLFYAVFSEIKKECKPFLNTQFLKQAGFIWF
jgi:hypothetical protein